MGFEDLASELHRHAETEGRRLVHAAEKSAEKSAEAAKEKADESLRAAKKEAAAFVKQESSERVTSARLSAKKLLDEARDEAVFQALQQVWAEFRSASLKKSAYPALFSRLLSEGLAELGTEDAILYVRDEDRPLCGNRRTAKLPSNYSGGLILERADGKVRVSKTLEDTFALHESSLRKQIYDRLF